MALSFRVGKGTWQTGTAAWVEWRRWSEKQREGKAWERVMVEMCKASAKQRWTGLELRLWKRGELWREFKGTTVVDALVKNVRKDVEWFVKVLEEKAGVKLEHADQCLKAKRGAEKLSVDGFGTDVQGQAGQARGWFELKRSKGECEETVQAAEAGLRRLWRAGQGDVSRKWENETMSNAGFPGWVKKVEWVASAIVVGEGQGMKLKWRRWSLAEKKWPGRERVWARRKRGRPETYGSGEDRREAAKESYKRYNKTR